jgi:Rod binding domain-containing protein
MLFPYKSLGLSEQRVKQLKRQVRKLGKAAVIHGNVGKHPANYIDEQLRRKIIVLKQSAAYERHFYHFYLTSQKKRPIF